ncbi:Rrf2 family transcriptional regulator [Actinokineospora sp. UTMC 2448]|uniref:RrF2 family transcriptional regulator n=1 Tax=Actinokineospora sp. UTMC 2448 TaxID=2268449 RepID=UPI00220C6AC9|nr:Rrf2 family transcriptional regulator [Actinokineospora sp. UTMC 2448]UVS79379.1 iron-responsive transcriptional regulator [Actinokineospora sp. UTMC 2448]
MSEGVEWALHTCANLAWVEPGDAVPAARLAAVFGLPAAYLNKQLQALVRAGILTSTSGPRGGFRLARAPEAISALDVVVAVEGAEDAFRCARILADSPWGDPAVDYRATCAISQTMRRAELAWRRELAGQSIADIVGAVERRNPGTGERLRRWLTAARA